MAEFVLLFLKAIKRNLSHKRGKNMMMEIEPSLKSCFPDLKVLIYEIKRVEVQKRSVELEKFKDEVMRQIRKKYDLESLKDLPTVRLYRDFFWRIGIDPTKSRPAAEALIRRILGGKPIPAINTLVDSYNLASIKTGIALAAFDMGKMKGNLLMRPSRTGEEFSGIGMEKSMVLQGGEIVISDEEKLVAIYPHRDAENTKVTEATKDILLMICGVPGIREENLLEAAQIAIEYITRFCGGVEKI